MELLVEVSRLLNEVDLDAVLQEVIGLASRAVGATRASLFLHTNHQVDWEHIFTARNLSAEESVKVVTRVLDEGFAGWVYRHKRGDIIRDTLHDDRWIIFPDDTLPVRSVLCVPFIEGETVLAVVTLVHPEPEHFTAHHLHLMTIISNQATIAIRNARLFNDVNSQRRQLQMVLQAMGDALLVLDAGGFILQANPVALRVLNAVHEDDVRGQYLADFVAQDNVFEPVIEIIEAGLGNNRHWKFETRSERRQIDYDVTMAVWADPLHSTSGYVIVMHDVTTLRDLHRFKDEMLRLATHDLRSPLALIAGYADIIGMDVPAKDSPVHDYLNIIKKSVERMGTLVDDLLRVERIRSSPLELHEQTDVEALVKVAVINSRPSATAKKQELTPDLRLGHQPRLVADPVLLRQAMENLIQNAIKYTPPGGKIQVSAWLENSQFHFSVQDNGIGISKEHLPYVFEAFYRVNNDSSEKGSGLGLSLVKNVITRHQGEVWVKSRPGKGSRFGFWLPLAMSA